MKKFLGMIYLLVVVAAIGCNAETAPSSPLSADQATETRGNGLSILVTYTNRQTASFSAIEIVGEEEADGLRVILDPGTLGEQTLTGVEELEVTGSNMTVTKNPGLNQQVYTNKTYLLAQDASSGFNNTVNPGNISFNATAISIE